MKEYDVILALYLRLYPDARHAVQSLADMMGGMSLSRIHAALKRLSAAGVLSKSESQYHVSPAALESIAIHSVRYFFPVKPMEMTRGIATAHSSGLLKGLRADEANAFVWPSAQGMVRGAAIAPLHKSVYAIIENEAQEKMYAALAYIDCFRVGRARDRSIAEKQFQELIR